MSSIPPPGHAACSTRSQARGSRSCIDPANLVETEPAEEKRRIIADAIDLLGDRIVMAHAKDRTADGRFATAGKGVLDYPHYLRQLKAIGFDGPLIAHGLAEAEAPETARFLKREMAAAGFAEEKGE